MRGEVLRKYKSNKLNTILITIKKGREDRDRNRLVNAVFGPGDIKLAFVKRMLSGPKERKKSNKMLIMGKAPCSVDHNNLLIIPKYLDFKKFEIICEGLYEATYMPD